MQEKLAAVTLEGNANMQRIQQTADGERQAAAEQLSQAQRELLSAREALTGASTSAAELASLQAQLQLNATQADERILELQKASDADRSRLECEVASSRAEADSARAARTERDELALEIDAIRAQLTEDATMHLPAAAALEQQATELAAVRQELSTTQADLATAATVNSQRAGDVAALQGQLHSAEAEILREQAAREVAVMEERERGKAEGAGVQQQLAEAQAAAADRDRFAAELVATHTELASLKEAGVAAALQKEGAQQAQQVQAMQEDFTQQIAELRQLREEAAAAERQAQAAPPEAKSQRSLADAFQTPGQSTPIASPIENLATLQGEISTLKAALSQSSAGGDASAAQLAEAWAEREQAAQQVISLQASVAQLQESGRNADLLASELQSQVSESHSELVRSDALAREREQQLERQAGESRQRTEEEAQRSSELLELHSALRDQLNGAEAKAVAQAGVAQEHGRNAAEARAQSSALAEEVILLRRQLDDTTRASSVVPSGDSVRPSTGDIGFPPLLKLIMSQGILA